MSTTDEPDQPEPPDDPNQPDDPYRADLRRLFELIREGCAR